MTEKTKEQLKNDTVTICIDCGKERLLRKKDVLNATTSLCNDCSRAKNLALERIRAMEENQSLVGQKFNNLTINNLYLAPQKNGTVRTYVDCDCSCGRKVVKAALNKIKSGEKYRCGYDHGK